MTRSEQNTWIKAQFKHWQTQWHDAFDKDTTLKADTQFQRPDPLPDDPTCDHRLTSGFSLATPQTRAVCLGHLPNGAKMAMRYESHWAATPEPLDEGVAREMAAKIGALVTQAEPGKLTDWGTITVLDQSDPKTRKALYNYDTLPNLFQRSMLNPHPEDDLTAIAGELFLSEPLYIAAGNWYDLGYWVTSAMFDNDQAAIYALNYQLWRGGWQLKAGPNDAVLVSHL